MECPKKRLHTKQPSGYLAWHEWAEKKSRKHHQVKCPGCGLFQIWKHNIRANSKGANLPVLTVKTYKENRKCNSVKDLARLRDFAAKNGHNRITISDYQLQTVISALQSSKGVEENWIDELGYYVQYAFDHCDELMEKFYPFIMQDFEFDEFYMSKSLCRLQVTLVHTAVSMSLVISTPDYIEWVQTMEDSNSG